MLSHAVPAALADAGVDPAHVIGIATDFTACTMVPTDADGTPLNELPAHAADPHAYVKLWKHHAAQPQADRINELAHKRGEAWLPRYGGLISSEWEFAKALELLEEAPEIYAEMAYFVEAADWIVWQLCGSYVRNACTAGYKGIYQDGTYPTRDFLAELNPEFGSFVEDKLDAPDRAARRRCRHAHRRSGRVDRSARGHPRRRRQRRRARHRRPRPTRSASARWSRSWAPRPATS